ncbi:leader peptide SpeFL [Pasteurella multocida]
MAHIRRTRHIMMPSYRSCFSYSIQASCYFLNITWRLRIYLIVP